MFRKASGLVAAGADVPRLGDQFQVAQGRVLCDGRQQRRAGVKATCAPPQSGGQIEAKSIEAGPLRPCPQAIHGEAHDVRAVQRQNIAAAGIVDIARRVFRIQPVIAGIVEAAQAQGRAKFIALSGMVQHHIQQHLDARRLQRRHRRADFRPAAGGEARIGGHQGDGIIAPDIGQPERGQVALVDPGAGGHDFQRGDAEPGKMRHRRWRAQPGKSAAKRRRHIGMGQRKAAHMRFIDAGLRPCNARACGRQRLVARNDRAFGHEGCAVAGVERRRGFARRIAKHRCMQQKRPVERQRMRVDQQLVGVEPVPRCGIKRAMGAKTIAVSGFQARYMAMENLATAFRQIHARGLMLA